MPNQRLNYLFDLYTQGNCTAAEKSELYALALALKNEEDVQALLDEYWDTQTIEFRMADPKAELMADSILHEQQDESSFRPVKVRKLLWKRVAVAASILLVIGIGSYFLFFNNSNKKQVDIVKVTSPVKDVAAPTTSKAMITLANGQVVYLDSLNSGTLATQGTVKVEKTADGKIVYSGNTTEIIYNTLNNPRGSKVIDIALADGSHVWLNAGSSIKFPVAFTGMIRDVQITGEAYFEVAHDVSKPFEVSKGNMHVTVLGTHFNVNAFDDEPNIKVTLLQGSIMVGNGEMRRELKPGQQAQVTSDIEVFSSVNTEQVMAWKNGRFQFAGTGLEEIMRQVSRWYDIEVFYGPGTSDLHFSGGISRDVEASKVLKMLEETEAIHFRIEGKKVFVSK